MPDQRHLQIFPATEAIQSDVVHWQLRQAFLWKKKQHKLFVDVHLQDLLETFLIWSVHFDIYCRHSIHRLSVLLLMFFDEFSRLGKSYSSETAHLSCAGKF